MSLDFDTKIDLDKAWESFLEIDQRELESKYFNKRPNPNHTNEIMNMNTYENGNAYENGADYYTDNYGENKFMVKKAPKASPIYISTKTKICYFNTEIDLLNTFWDIPIIEYHIAKNGILKKQVKINCATKDDTDRINKCLDKERDADQYIEEYIINKIDNPNGRVKYKDVRKISIGVCKKDILSYRSKKKSAFYNCFVIILRIFYIDGFKEIHVKIFNTGKIEIPGVQNDELFDMVLDMLLKTFKDILNNKDLAYNMESNETVLINSNFNCGFYINRENLFNILRFKYKINSCYDPCSYPGIQCQFYYDKRLEVNDGRQRKPNGDGNGDGDANGDVNGDANGDNESKETVQKLKKNTDPNILKISFMIFRTGSVLIVGKCDEYVIKEIYEFVKNMLQSEYHQIATKSDAIKPTKSTKTKKKLIYIYKTKI
jgi:TATA-box binding protein (TBP) (component of TFIID and TFIIIB)